MIEGVKGDWLTLERIPTYDNIVAFTSFEVIYQTQGRMFHQISKDWDMGWKNKGLPSFFLFTNFEVSGYLMKPSFECDIGSQCIN